MKRKITFAIDIHQTIADLSEVWLEDYNRDYGDKLTTQDLSDYDLSLAVKPECGRKIFDYLKDLDLYRRMKPIPGALDRIKDIREQGHRVLFVTNTLLSTAEVNFEWLVQHGFLESHQKDNYVVCVDKSLIRADVIVDDKIENVVCFHGVGIMVTRPWNIWYPWPEEMRLASWEQTELFNRV